MQAHFKRIDISVVVTANNQYDTLGTNSAPDKWGFKICSMHIRTVKRGIKTDKRTRIHKYHHWALKRIVHADVQHCDRVQVYATAQVRTSSIKHRNAHNALTRVHKLQSHRHIRAYVYGTHVRICFQFFKVRTSYTHIHITYLHNTHEKQWLET